ncbi:SusC/RagA family TonB-linked outer membrane protein [Bacteroidia bacterium]|nr:SusC/RagA family TonB-linked outer membrane protein [Bacteroidia bacterium]
MKKIKRYVLLAVLTFLPAGLMAKEVKGTVIDKETRKPIEDAMILSGDNAGKWTVADDKGKFSIEVTDKCKFLNVYLLGYKSVDVPIDGQTGEITVELTPSIMGLDEVVVTGQGAAIQKRRISSNVVSIGQTQLALLPQNRIDEMLQTALPNVQINLTSGQPGATSLIKSRGLSSAFVNATPVIYVDGVRIDNLNTKAQLTSGAASGVAGGSIADIPMENIEKIEYVTGGAATTLYGSDAANGVIQIFTKKGGNGKTNFYGETELGADIPTDRFYHFKQTKELLHQTGFVQRYRLGFNGGTQDFGYSFAGSMSNQDGTLIHDRNFNKKYDFSVGFKVKLSNPVHYAFSFGSVLNEYGRDRNGNEGGYTGLWFAEAGRSGTGFGFNPELDKLTDAELAEIKAFVDKAEALQNATVSVKRFQNAHTLTVKPHRSLVFNGTMGIDYRTNTDKTVTTNEYLIHTRVYPEGTADQGSITNYDRNYFGLTVDINGQWKTNIGSLFSQITTAGFQFFSTHDHQVAYSGMNLRDGALSITGAGVKQSDEYLSFLYNHGFFLQENIGFKDKFFLDLGLRTDYNTAFGENVGWQYYPKIGFSYSLAEESFMAEIKPVVSDFKWRANYGIAGNYPQPFSHQKTISLGSFQDKQYATFGNYGNPDLGPEKKHSYEAGFDASFFDRRLTTGFTYYYTRTKDALFNVPAPPSTGYDTYLANVGEIENKGVELSVHAILVHCNGWDFSVNASYNTNANVVLSTGGAAPFAVGGMSSRTLQNVVEVGQPVGFLRGSKAVLNPDGSLKEVLLLQNLGSVIPTGYGNFGFNLAYRGLSFFAAGSYQVGAYVHSFDRQFRFSYNMEEPRIPEKALEGTTQGAQVWNFSNFFVEKADFLKIRTIGASYRWTPNRWLPTVRHINFSANVYNPFTFTRCSMDPEAVHSGATTQGAIAAGGFNYSVYSTPVQVVGTLRLTF